MRISTRLRRRFIDEPARGWWSVRKEKEVSASSATTSVTAMLVAAIG